MLQHLVALLLLTVCTSAATITIFDVSPTGADGSTGDPLTHINLSPLGVGSDGATTYDFVEAISPTETVHAVIVAGATQIHLSAATPFPLVKDCSWKNTSDEGVCTFFDAEVGTTQTFTGRVTPVFTLTVDDTTTSRPTSDDTSLQGTPTSSTAPGGQSNSATNRRSSAIVLGGAVALSLLSY